MKSKLPVVGKRYRRNFDDKRTYIVVRVISGKDSRTGCETYDIRDQNDLNYHAMFNADFMFDEITFKYEFEELPDSNPQETEAATVGVGKGFGECEIYEITGNVNQTPNPVDLEKGEVSEVERALKELKHSLNHKDNCEYKGHLFNNIPEEHWKPLIERLNAVKYKAQNLINALEAEKATPKFETII